MELTKLHQHIDNLPKEQANAILGIVDLKTEENMEKQLAEMRAISGDINNIRMEMNARFDAYIKSVEDMRKNLTLMMAILTLLLGYVALVK